PLGKVWAKRWCRIEPGPELREYMARIPYAAPRTAGTRGSAIAVMGALPCTPRRDRLGPAMGAPRRQLMARTTLGHVGKALREGRGMGELRTRNALAPLDTAAAGEDGRLDHQVLGEPEVLDFQIGAISIHRRRSARPKRPRARSVVGYYVGV